MNRPIGKKCIILSLILILIIPSAAIGSGSEGGDDSAAGNGKRQEELPPQYANVSVHDPSVVKDGDTYYVFGSHIEAARSKDLMSWTRFTNGYATPGNVIYGDLSQNLAGSFAWAGENDSDSKGGFSVWAPDVFWNPDYVNEDGTLGAYMIYYCTSSTYIRSAIGYAVSQSIEGPYKYADTILYSGFTRDEAYDANSVVNKKWSNTNISALIDNGALAGTSPNWFNGDRSYNNSRFPNAIDPNLFRGKDGKLWMAYGSWSGGIYMIRIDERTGKAVYPGNDGSTADGRPIDRYFGTQVAGGFTKSGEGPYVVYNEDTGYYYLYVTYGWLGADGGYNMRVFRSKEADGPYVDAAGLGALLPGNTDNSAFGNKLMGNFLFKREVGDPGRGIGFGYVSPGHNSVYYDKDTGRQFLVFHSRFPKTGEFHEVRVHQLFMNKDGWPVAAPYRYAGEKLEKADRQELVGEYKFIDHGKETTANIATSAYIRLDANNKVTGDYTGTWKKTGQNEAEITVGGDVYMGVFVKGWDPTAERFTMTFTAMSKEGVAVWGSRQPDKTDQEIVSDVIRDLDLGDTSGVVSDLALPEEGARHARIEWATSDAEVVTETGVIRRPEAGEEAATAVLTATVSKGEVKQTKSFQVTVLLYREAVLTAQYSFEERLNDALGRFGEGTATGDRIDNAGGAITYAEGKHGKAAAFDGASGVRLPDGLIDGASYAVSLWLKPEQLTTYTTAFFGARDSNNWVSLVPSGPAAGNTMVWSGSASWYDGATGLTIPVGEWTHLAFSVDNGTLTVYVNGDRKFAGSGFPSVFTAGEGSFSLGVNWWDPPYKGLMDELRIYDGALTPSQVASLAGIE